MQFWVAVTNKAWFERLRAQAPDEVNFWQPSPRPVAGFLEPGVPFLFKLHAPDNFIVGGGFFVRFSALPARLAWEAFGEKNGVEDYDALRVTQEAERGLQGGHPHPLPPQRHPAHDPGRTPHRPAARVTPPRRLPLLVRRPDRPEEHGPSRDDTSRELRLRRAAGRGLAACCVKDLRLGEYCRIQQFPFVEVTSLPHTSVAARVGGTAPWGRCQRRQRRPGLDAAPRTA